MSPPKNQTQESIDSLVETSSRHDERINNLIGNNDSISEEIKALKKELIDLKLSLESYKLKIDNMNGFWEKVFDSAWKLALMVIGATILYFLKLQSPPS
jgi:hypothetical protein